MPDKRKPLGALTATPLGKMPKPPAWRQRGPVVETPDVCSATGCATVLSRYNRGDLCGVHMPTRYPTVRGTKR